MRKGDITPPEAEDEGFPFSASDLEDLETSDGDGDGDDDDDTPEAAEGEETAAKPEGEASGSEGSDEAPLSEMLRNEVLRLRVEELAATILQHTYELQTSSALMETIRKEIPDQVEKQVNALIDSWLNSQLQLRVEKLVAVYLKRQAANNQRLLAEEGGRPPPADVRRGKAKDPREEQQNGRESGVQPAWTPAEQMNVLRNVPEPLIKTKDFHVWLRRVCIVYGLRPANISKLLLLAYGPEWEDVQRHFHVPGAAADADWPDGHAMTTWLDGSCVTSIQTAAQNKIDFSAVYACVQKPKELVSDFLQRFQQVWDATVGMSRDDRCSLAVSMLVSCLQPHVSDQFKMKCTDWKLFSFKKAAQALVTMEQQGRFTSRGKALRLTRMLEISGPDGDRCSYCDKLGHWAEDCRSKARLPALMFRSVD